MIEKKNVIQAIIACVVGLLIYALCVAIDLNWYAEKYAVCDGGYTVWRINPAAFLSYRYEIRTGIVRLDTWLTWNETRDFFNDNHCKPIVAEA